MRSSDGALNSSYIFLSVTTAPLPPANVIIDEINLTSFRVNWSIVTGATGYNLSIYEDLLSPPLHTFSLITDVFQTVSGLNPSTIYYYQLQSFNGSSSSIVSGNLNTLIPPPVSKEAIEVFHSSMIAIWDPVNVAQSYSIDLSFSVNFSNYVRNDLSVMNTQYMFSGLVPNETYYYRVRSVNMLGRSDYSNVITLTTGPPVPVIIHSNQISDTSINVLWNPSDLADEYILQVSKDEGFTMLLPDYSGLIIEVNHSSYN